MERLRGFEKAWSIDFPNYTAVDNRTTGLRDILLGKEGKGPYIFFPNFLLGELRGRRTAYNPRTYFLY